MEIAGNRFPNILRQRHDGPHAEVGAEVDQLHADKGVRVIAEVVDRGVLTGGDFPDSIHVVVVFVLAPPVARGQVDGGVETDRVAVAPGDESQHLGDHGPGDGVFTRRDGPKIFQGNRRPGQMRGTITHRCFRIGNRRAATLSSAADNQTRE